MANFEEGSWVWIPDAEEVIIPAKVKSYCLLIKKTLHSGSQSVTLLQALVSFKPGEAAEVETEAGEKRELTAEQTKTCTECAVECLDASVDNLISLGGLNESAILHNLRIRFKKDQIYTFVSTILISVNPFKMLDLYSAETLEKYTSGQAKTMPHCWSIADNAFQALMADYSSQSCIIAGESGAGKSEATKLVLQYLAEVSSAVSGNGTASASEGDEDCLEQQILQANPVMEALGNAKTVRNNNSSRFGKLIKVSFDRAGGIVGGSIINYLLEKSRVVTQAKGERNYHCFYQLLAGADVDAGLKSKLSLRDADEFHYLNQSGVTEVAGMNDLKEWNEVMSAMKVLAIPDFEKDSILQILAGVMHFGNVDFEVVVNSTSEDGCKVNDTSAVDTAAKLFGVDSEELTTAITQKNIGTRSIILVSFSQEQATDARDAIAKALFSKLFDHLIHDINNKLSQGIGDKGGADLKMIGVLDIFGFESFESNSFEQLCINYCNEKLQFHFNDHIFSLEQTEYEKEGISVAHITFVDNQPTLDLLEKKGTGIFSMVDEEINVPRGSDDGVLQKILKNHKDHKSLTKPKPKSCLNAHSCFVVEHYAGPVAYNITNFLEKNKDTLGEDVKKMFKRSHDTVVAGLFEEQTRDAAASMASTASKGSRGSTSRRKKPAGKSATIGAQFKKQLADLMETLSQTSPHFIRCMKPNAEKIGNVFTSEMVLGQLRYAGLLEVCRIRQIGYPVRREFDRFFRSYLPIKPGSKDIDDLLNQLSEGKVLVEGEWAKGKEKVFLRNQQAADLEVAREEALRETVLRIQKSIRRMIYFFRFHQHLKTLRNLVTATAERSVKELEDNLNMAAELPFHGVHMPQVKAAKALLPRLLEEERMVDMLKQAVASQNEDEVDSAIQAAEGMDPPLVSTRPDAVEALEAAKSIKSTLAEQRAVKTKLKEAMTKRDLAMISELMAQAETLGINDCDEIQAATVLRQRLQDEEATVEMLVAAIASRKLVELQAAVSKIEELGLGDRPEVATASQLMSSLEAEAKASKALRLAIDAKDVAALTAAINAAGSAGVAATNETLAEANTLKAKLVQQAEAVAVLKAAIEARDGAKLEAAIAAGGAAGLAGDEQLVTATQVLESVQAEQGALKVLKEAIESKKADKLRDALAKAAELNMSSATVEEVAEAEKALDKIEGGDAATAALREAVRSNDLKKLEAAIVSAESGDVPADAIADAKKALEKLKEEDVTVQEIEKALGLVAAGQGDHDALSTAVATATRMNLQRPELMAKARSELEKLGIGKKVRQMFEAARRARTVEAVEAVIEEAGKQEAAGGADVTKLLGEAKELRDVVGREAELAAKVEEALETKDKGQLTQLIEEADSMRRGRSKSTTFDSAQLRRARILVDREGMMEETKEELKKAIAEKDLRKLNDALNEATELGMEGEEIEAAKEAQAKFDVGSASAKTLDAKTKALGIKAETGVDIEEAELSELEALAAKVKESDGTSEEMKKKAARTVYRFALMIKVQEELKAALQLPEGAEMVKGLKSCLHTALELEETQIPLVRKIRERLAVAREEAGDDEEEDEESESDCEDEDYDEAEAAEEKRKFEAKLEHAKNPKYRWVNFANLRDPDDFAKGKMMNKSKVKDAFLRSQKNQLHKSLQKLNDKKSKLAAQLHKNILGYCGDKAMSFPAALARGLLETGQNEGEEIADELYLQVLKHLTENPNPASEANAWHLLCMMVNNVPPSREVRALSHSYTHVLSHSHLHALPPARDVYLAFPA
jgi:myosin heavy subunit